VQAVHVTVGEGESSRAGDRGGGSRTAGVHVGHRAASGSRLATPPCSTTATGETAEGPRKGEPSRKIMRYGLRTQPALLVRARSRRIMSLRFRPAHISVINRRACSRLFPVLLSNAHGSPAGTRFPPEPPVPSSTCQNGARLHGPLRRACGAPLHAPRRSSPFPYATGGSGGNKSSALSEGLDRSLHINSPKASAPNRSPIHPRAPSPTPASIPYLEAP